MYVYTDRVTQRYIPAVATKSTAKLIKCHRSQLAKLMGRRGLELIHFGKKWMV